MAETVDTGHPNKTFVSRVSVDLETAGMSTVVGGENAGCLQTYSADEANQRGNDALQSRQLDVAVQVDFFVVVCIPWLSASLSLRRQANRDC